MVARSAAASMLLIAATIAAGLALRLVHLGLPGGLVKYGGSMLWALMLYWIVAFLRPRWSPVRSGIVACAVAWAVELFKLHHGPALDGFRLTLPGALLLGRIFSPWDLLAYSVAIGLGVVVDRRLTARRASAERRFSAADRGL